MPAPVLLHYDLDSDALGHSSRAKLDRVADLLERRPELGVHIEGHADESGSEEHNQTLSEGRAQAVAEYLEEHGVPAPRLSVSAFGELHPLEAGGERDRKNRRVEIRFAASASKGDPE